MHLVNDAADVAPQKDPYVVEKYPSVNGTIILIGRDSHGEIKLQLQMPADWYSPQMVGRMIRTLKAHDTPPLSLVP